MPGTERAAERVDAASNLAFAVLAAACVWPLFYVRYLPIEDLPQHLAAIRVLHDFSNPAFDFARYFEVDLWRTQYLAYYLAADLLSYVVNIELANKLLVAASLVATPYALRGLLAALGKDPRLGLLAFPLAYNAHLVLGFFNFLAAIPLSFYGVTLAIRQRRSASRGRGILLAGVALVCFYTHVVPFMLLALGVGLVALSRDLRACGRGLLPLLPAGLAALVWLAQSPAGRATLSAARGTAQGKAPEFLPYAVALAETPRWLTDVFEGRSGLRLMQAWAALALLCVVLAVVDRLRRVPERAPDALTAQLAWRLALLSPLCALLYFVAPTSYDWIWPIAQRFPLLCALWLVVALPRFASARTVVLVLACVLASASFHLAGNAFAKFEREEVGDFEAALAALPRAKRVAGLIFERGSAHIAFSPFIHYVAYYQAEKGGAVMFTFADFPQSPFHFREDHRPPRVAPRWEWLPERVRPRSDLGWYDYALVRGGPGALARPDSGFALRYRGPRWSVWQNLH